MISEPTRAEWGRKSGECTYADIVGDRAGLVSRDRVFTDGSLVGKVREWELLGRLSDSLDRLLN